MLNAWATHGHFALCLAFNLAVRLCCAVFNHSSNTNAVHLCSTPSNIGSAMAYCLLAIYKPTAHFKQTNVIYKYVEFNIIGTGHRLFIFFFSHCRIENAYHLHTRLISFHLCFDLTLSSTSRLFALLSYLLRYCICFIYISLVLILRLLWIFLQFPARCKWKYPGLYDYSHHYADVSSIHIYLNTVEASYSISNICKPPRSTAISAFFAEQSRAFVIKFHWFY